MGCSESKPAAKTGGTKVQKSVGAGQQPATEQRKAAALNKVDGPPPKKDADAKLWNDVHKYWKTPDGKMFDAKKLQEHFPGEQTPAQMAKRKEIFSSWNSMGTGRLSLAEFGGSFNDYTIKIEGGKAEDGKSSLFVYCEHCLIRAFALANGVGKGDAQLIERSEMRMLMLGIVSVLLIYRCFDVLDTSGDKRITEAEWKQNYGGVNTVLRDVGAHGAQVGPDDFKQADQDGQGAVLLKEMVSFLLTRVCSDPKLISQKDE